MSDKELIAEAKSRMSGDIHMPGRVFLTGVIDALEARQPTESDREAKAEALKEWQSGNEIRQYSEFYTSWEDGYDAGFFRAAVPDAATEEFESLIYPDYEGLAAAVFERSHEPAFSDDSRGLREARAFAESLVEMYIDQQGLKQLKAERDAALAAIERVRVVAFGHGKGAEDLPVDRDALKAALDGAPEPEWEYGSGPEDALDQSGLHTSRATAERGVAEWNEFTQRSERMGGRPLERLVLVRRRKAGPWLPVEGKSK